MTLEQVFIAIGDEETKKELKSDDQANAIAQTNQLID